MPLSLGFLALSLVLTLICQNRRRRCSDLVIDKEFVQVIANFKGQLNMFAALFGRAFEMAHFAALHASFVTVVVLAIP